MLPVSPLRGFFGLRVAKFRGLTTPARAVLALRAKKRSMIRGIGAGEVRCETHQVPGGIASSEHEFPPVSPNTHRFNTPGPVPNCSPELQSRINRPRPDLMAANRMSAGNQHRHAEPSARPLGPSPLGEELGGLTSLAARRFTPPTRTRTTAIHGSHVFIVSHARYGLQRVRPPERMTRRERPPSRKTHH